MSVNADPQSARQARAKSVQTSSPRQQIVDLARLSCQDDEMIVQLSKLLETVLLTTSTPQYSPLNSVSLYMASCTEEVRKQYYQKIRHDQPYDISYVRLMLLGRQYRYFRDVIRDVERSFQHYNSMFKQLGLPDVVPSARQFIYQIVHEMNFALFVRLPLNDQLFDEVQRLTDEELGEPVRIVSAGEARLFQFLCQSFTEQQNDRLY